MGTRITKVRPDATIAVISNKSEALDTLRRHSPNGILIDQDNNLIIGVTDSAGLTELRFVGSMWISGTEHIKYPLRKAPKGTSFTLTQS